ncbi:MAG: hypothetical protein KDD56_07380 [Bdellovibrionales bacterium]|nr:hypothetical protein [Bdellovibrionales bacterium]
MKLSLCILFILSGLLLVPLLPIGASETFGTNSILYQIVFCLHLIFFCTCIYLSILEIYRTICTLGKIKLLILPIICIIFCFIISLDLLPVSAGDALIHHLVVPKWWLKAGKIYYIDFHSWSNYPMLINLAFTGIMQFAPAEFCALYHAAYLIILAALISEFLRNKNEHPYLAPIAVIMIIGLPIFIRLAATPLVDLGLAAYSFLCLKLVFEDNQKTINYFLAGISLGLALSIKYNAILVGFVCTLLLIAFMNYRNGQNLKHAAKILALFCFGALIVYLPWMIKNYLWTNNPIYPLFNSYFSTKSPPSLGGLNPIEHRRLIYQESWFDFLLLPFRMIFNGQDFKGKYFDGVLHPILILGFIGLFKSWKKRWVRGFSIFAVFYFLLATTLALPRTRYLAPMLPIWICLSSLGFIHLLTITNIKLQKKVFTIFFSVYLFFTAIYLKEISERSLLIPYLNHKISKLDYLKITVPDYELINWVNNQLPETSKIYLLNTANRFYYFDRNVISSGHDSSAGIVNLLREKPSASSVASELKAEGVTHIMANMPRTIDIMEAELVGENRNKWNEFQQKYLKPLVQSGSTALWELK